MRSRWLTPTFRLHMPSSPPNSRNSRRARSDASRRPSVVYQSIKISSSKNSRPLSLRMRRTPGAPYFCTLKRQSSRLSPIPFQPALEAASARIARLSGLIHSASLGWVSPAIVQNAASKFVSLPVIGIKPCLKLGPSCQQRLEAVSCSYEDGTALASWPLRMGFHCFPFANQEYLASKIRPQLRNEVRE